MPKELKNPRHSANLSKFGHDMSKIIKFSSNVGQLIPVYYDHLLPGDKVKFNTEMFTQMTDVVSPAMLHLEEQIDWFFVPYKLLYQFANDNMFSIDDSATAYRPTLGDPSVFPMIKGLRLFRLDDLGGDLTIGEVFDSEQSNTLLDAFGDPSLSQYSENYDMFGVPKLYNAVRLLQHLGFGEEFMVKPDDVVQGEEFYYNIYHLLAYQKIFYDHYRNTDRTRNNVLAYNVDDLSGQVVEIAQGSRIDDILALHYVQWKKDFFTSTHVAPLIDVGSVGMASTDGERLTKVENWLSLGTPQNTNGNGEPNLSIGSSSAGTSPTSTALLRSMFAVEKLMEITRQAAKHYDAQVLAHLGFKVPEGIANEVYRLGSDRSIINFKEVVALADGTAGDSTTVLGQKGGKGQGYNANNDKSFVAPCHGIIMAVYHAEPDADYDCRMLDNFNTLDSRAKFFHPEFDRMGQEPLFRYQAVGTLQNYEYANSRLGWNWRYLYYKLKFNQAFGNFVYNVPYTNWTVFRDMQPFFDALDTFSGDGLPESFFYVSPFSIDNIMLLHARPNYTSDVVTYQKTENGKTRFNLSCVYARDNMEHWFRFNVFKSSIISNYSLPSL